MKQKALSILILSMQCGLMANPSNPTVVNGDVSFDSSTPGVLNIQAGDRSIINWQDFSIGLDEATQFIQPDAGSAVLNRVTGGNASSIMGSLQANGVVYLINPNGVIFGKDSVVDTAAIIASTLDLPDQLFLQDGDLLFSGDSQGILLNFGTIQASNGDAILIGYQVENNGSVNAPNGVAGIAAGSEVLIRPLAEERIYIRVGSDSLSQSEVGLSNAGVINALQAELKADGNPFTMAINHSGSVTATGIQEMGGIVYLVTENGDIDISGSIAAQDGFGNGGAVAVSGQNVTMEFESEIIVDGWDVGNGGTAIVLGGNNVAFYGAVSAQGGDFGGDGGFIELSAPGLIFSGEVSTYAPAGETGTLLLDPNNITITTNVTTGAFVSNGGDEFYDGNGSPTNTANLNNDDLATTLMSSNVIVQTYPDTNSPGGSISFQAPVVVPMGGSAFTLTVIADQDIDVNNLLINNGTGGFSLVSKHGDINVVSTASAPAQIGSQGNSLIAGLISLQAAGNVNVISNGMYAQVGMDLPNVNCDIEIKSVGKQLIVQGGTGYAAIGHGGPSGLATSLQGDITIDMIGNTSGDGALIIQGGTAAGMRGQIGHYAKTASAVTISGDVSAPSVLGPASLTGGTATDTPAIFGHGSSNGIISGSTLEGNIELIVETGVTLSSGTASGSLAVAGFTNGAVNEAGGIIVNPAMPDVTHSLTVLTSNENISVTANGSHACIGALFNNTATANTITIDDLSVIAEGSVSISGSTTTAGTYAIVGTTSNPAKAARMFTDTVSSDVTIFGAGDFSLASGLGSAQVLNGNTPNTDFSVVIVAGHSVQVSAGTQEASIFSTGDLGVSAVVSDVTLFSSAPASTVLEATSDLQVSSGLGNVQLNDPNPMTVLSPVLVQNSEGDLTIYAAKNIALNPYSSVLQLGDASGDVFLQSTFEDISIIGPQAFVENNTDGDVTFFAGKNILVQKTRVRNPGDGMGGIGTFTLRAGNDIVVGSNINAVPPVFTTAPTEIGQTLGEMVLRAGNDLIVAGGSAANAGSFLGAQDTVAMTVDMKVTEVKGSVHILGGSATNTPAQFGPKSTANVTSNIKFKNVYNDLNIIASPNMTDTGSYAQIGVIGDAVTSTVNLRVGGATTLTGSPADGGYAQVGAVYMIPNISEKHRPLVNNCYCPLDPGIMCSGNITCTDGAGVGSYAIIGDVGH